MKNLPLKVTVQVTNTSSQRSRESATQSGSYNRVDKLNLLPTICKNK